jgi:CheY-like chemotaxis protein
VSEGIIVLIVEDGNEYLENLSRFVEGPDYLQAHNAVEAVEILKQTKVDLVYMDMRFDRIELKDLQGDHAEATRRHNGDPQRGWRYLQNNQGLYVLNHLKESGYGHVPTVLSYDFSREQRRFEFLQKTHPHIAWVSDSVTPDGIRTVMAQLLVRGE